MKTPGGKLNIKGFMTYNSEEINDKLGVVLFLTLGLTAHLAWSAFLGLAVLAPILYILAALPLELLSYLLGLRLDLDFNAYLLMLVCSASVIAAIVMSQDGPPSKNGLSPIKYIVSMKWYYGILPIAFLSWIAYCFTGIYQAHKASPLHGSAEYELRLSQFDERPYSAVTMRSSATLSERRGKLYIEFSAGETTDSGTRVLSYEGIRLLLPRADKPISEKDFRVQFDKQANRYRTATYQSYLLSDDYERYLLWHRQSSHAASLFHNSSSKIKSIRDKLFIFPAAFWVLILLFSWMLGRNKNT